MTSVVSNLKNLLIVDDDEHIRCLFGQFLGRHDYNIKLASDGKEALDILKNYYPDLLVTDVLMPNIEGLELILKAKNLCPNIKIIALSGGGVVDADQCLQFAGGVGADKVFAKPIRPNLLLQAINDLLSKSIVDSNACLA